MTTIAIPVFRRCVTRVAACLVLVLEMGDFRRELCLIASSMTVPAGRPVFHFFLGTVHPAISVKLPLIVAVHAHHPLFVVDIRTTAILTDEFRVNPAAVAEGAGLSFISFHKPMTLDETNAYPADRGRLHVAVATGGMTDPAGLLEDLFIEDFRFCLGKSFNYTVPLANRRIVERFLICGNNLPVAFLAHLKIGGRPLFHIPMSQILILLGIVTLVTIGAPLLKMLVLCDQFLVNQETLVIFFRLN